jgi:TM2 domain-containing membrane protein YozV
MTSLSDQKRLLIETQYGNRKKSVGVAYLLLFLTGVGHNFYLGRSGRGVLQFFLCLIAVGILWIICDWFTLAGTVKTQNSSIYNDLTMAALREG